MSIIKFERKGCAPCKNVSALLDSKGVKYTSVDVEESPDFSAEFGIATVPVLILINNENEVLARVNGFDIGKINSLIEKA